MEFFLYYEPYYHVALFHFGMFLIEIRVLLFFRYAHPVTLRLFVFLLLQPPLVATNDLPDEYFNGLNESFINETKQQQNSRYMGWERGKRSKELFKLNAQKILLT